MRGYYEYDAASAAPHGMTEAQIKRAAKGSRDKTAKRVKKLRVKLSESRREVYRKVGLL